MHLQRLWLTDFRSYPTVEVSFPPGVTAVIGDNGRGKTNLLEAIGYVATLRSFRGAPPDALVRSGAERGVVRAEVSDAGRTQLVEAEIQTRGRGRVLLNRQRLQRSRDLLGVLRVTVFSPDDLELVKGPPTLRRDFLDDALVALHPPHDLVRSEWERALRQRNALLRQVHGRLDEAGALTLEVWDDKLARAGEELSGLRERALGRLGPEVRRAYRDVAGHDAEVHLRLHAPWRTTGLAEALIAARDDELRRGVTLVGPHRDDVVIELSGLPARTHASQGEQRCLALALRLALHRLLTADFGRPPVLLLDDVLSELDPGRASALLRSLPVGQTVLSSATRLPEGVDADLVVRVEPGRLEPVRPGT